MPSLEYSMYRALGVRSVLPPAALVELSNFIRIFLVTVILTRWRFPRRKMAKQTQKQKRNRSSTAQGFELTNSRQLRRRLRSHITEATRAIGLHYYSDTLFCC